MRNSRTLLAEAAALGTIAGMRSMLPLAALELGLGRRRRRAPRWLRSPAARIPLLVGAAGELVYDKLPIATSRLAAPGLVARVGTAGVAGAIVAQLLGESRALGAAVGIGAAIASSFLFHRLRSAIDRRGVPDVASGLVEDAIALGASSAVARSLVH
jgi:uncharacterized membrane protein